jgi:hypothetical protein
MTWLDEGKGNGTPRGNSSIKKHQIIGGNPESDTKGKEGRTGRKAGKGDDLCGRL